MIVLHTDVISDLMKPAPSLRLVERLRGVPGDDQATTAVSLGELAYGAARVDRPELFERALGLLRGLRVLAFDAAAARHYGELRARLEAGGTRLADPDLRIAATVLAAGRGTTLVTGNLRYFERVPDLVAEDWIRA